MPYLSISYQLILENMAPTDKRRVMKKTRLSKRRMLKILREADCAPGADVAKKHGISAATIYA